MESFKPSNILVFGATGNIGKFIVEGLIRAQPAFPSITVFTSGNSTPSKAELLDGWRAAGVSIIVGDVTNPSEVEKAYSSGVDTVISALGREGLIHQIELLRLAEKTDNVKWFLPSEYGTDTEHNDKSAQEKPHQNKLAVHRFVREEIRRVKVTYVVVGPYFNTWVGMSAALREKLGGIDAQNKRAVLLGEGEQKISFTTMVDVGKAVVAALRHPEAKQTLRIASFVVTANQVLAEFERQVGSKFDVRYIPLADVEANEQSMWENKHPAAVVATLGRIWLTGGAEYPSLDNEAIGLGTQVETLSQAVEEQIRMARARA